MELALHILAALGFAATVWRSLRSAVRALGRGVEAFFARELARTRARRGDLSGMEEASGSGTLARRAQWRALGALAGWIVVMAVPSLLPAPPAPLYAAYVVFWFIPRSADANADDPVGVRR